MALLQSLMWESQYEQKQQWMLSQLAECWAADDVWRIWEVELYKEQVVTKKGTKTFWNPTYFERCLSYPLKIEIKYACYILITTAHWQPGTFSRLGSIINRIIDWINVEAITIKSFNIKTATAWENSLENYLKTNELYKEYQQKHLKKEGIKTYHQTNQTISTFRQIYKIIQALYDERSEYEKDKWDLRKLGKDSSHCNQYTIDFSQITQPWLYQAAKKFIRYSINTGDAISTCRGRLTSLIHLSRFLSKTYTSIKPSQINRSVVIELIDYISGIGKHTHLHTLVDIKLFFEICGRENWLDIPRIQLIYSDDYPVISKPLPRYIPEEVIKQLEQHLDTLPSMYRIMTLILKECGRRISEICTLEIDCLRQDAAGDWWLFYYQHKMKKEHRIPILSKEVTEAIHSQRQTVLNERGSDCKYLFPSPHFFNKHIPIRGASLAGQLNKLAHNKQICDSTGIWRFQTHQFRHTVGTRMINNGVAQHFVQEFLGHESPEMTSRYAHIFDQTLKEEFAKFKGKIVDITGKSVEPESIASDIAEGLNPNNIDAQWLKKNILAQALPNGTCARPVIKGSCPHANACLTCGDFRTTIEFLNQHKEQLEQTEKIIEKAKVNGWQRQVEMNEQVKINLENIISSLESKNAKTR